MMMIDLFAETHHDYNVSHCSLNIDRYSLEGTARRPMLFNTHAPWKAGYNIEWPNKFCVANNLSLIRITAVSLWCPSNPYNNSPSDDPSLFVPFEHHHFNIHISPREEKNETKLRIRAKRILSHIPFLYKVKPAERFAIYDRIRWLAGHTSYTYLFCLSPVGPVRHMSSF